MRDTKYIESSKTLPFTAVIVETILMCLFAVLTAIGAQIEIPVKPVPFTLQTLFVLLAGVILGKNKGFLSMVIYITLGIAGLPVFSSGGFGIAKIIGPTGGYIMAFPVSAYIVGYLVRNSSSISSVAFSMFVGSFVIFFLGTFHLNFFYLHNWNEALKLGCVVFTFWDLVKIIAASWIAWHYLNMIRK